MFKIVFRDSSLYPKQLPLFCLLRLISASADRVGYISNFCSMIELLYELKNSIFLTQKHSGIGYYIRRKKGKLTFAELLHIIKIESFLAYFMRIIHSCSVLQDSILQTGVRARRSSHTLSMLDGSHSTRHQRSIILQLWIARMQWWVFYYAVLICSLIFLQLWTAVSWRWLYFPPTC